MKASARRYGFCKECSTIEEGNLEATYTVQWLREVTVPRSRSSWGPRHPQLKYVCQVCGTENY